MTDTVRTLAALQTALADNTSSNITPQSLRDAVVSLFAYASPINKAIAAPAVGTYVIDLAADVGFTINTLTTVVASGSLTLSVQINGTNVTGLTNIAVTSTPATATATAANAVAIGQKVTLVVSAASSPVGIDYKLTRTAA